MKKVFVIIGRILLLPLYILVGLAWIIIHPEDDMGITNWLKGE